MQTNFTNTAVFANISTLVSLDNDQLIDLLAHKTRLLIAATVAKLPDKDFMQNLNSEVETIQTEIKNRKAP